MTLFVSSIWRLLILAPLASCSIVAPIIELVNGNLSGSYSDIYNITYYRKIPFAASPVGRNRFRAPQPLSPTSNGTYDADQPFDNCVQSSGGSEDCLYLGVYSRPWKPGARRPVVVEIHGGAYSAGTASFNIPPFGYPTLNASTTNDFLFVYPAYRLNVFGFLAGTDIKKAKDVDLNVGLLDQQAALRWVHENIEQFGGDPRNVSLWGQSAGGGSVIAQAIANKGETRPKLFHRALVNSPYWVKQYRYNDPEAESVYTQMLNLTNCADWPNGIACLRAVDQRALYNASLSVKPYKPWHTAYSLWSPVADGEFLHERLSAAVDGKLNAELVWATSNTHEGERFVSSDLQLANSTSALNSSAAGFDYWLGGYLAHFTTSDLTEVKSLYPPAGATETFVYNSTYSRAGLIYRDTVLTCPGYWLASSARQGWQADYTVPPAVHGSEQVYVCGEPGYNSSCKWNWWDTGNETESTRYVGLAGAFSSFLQTGDPNAYKLTNEVEPQSQH
ncbi:putative Carboxylesterase [Seiridium cardinale]|uniref:Carboxylic ester hydrolase n=1 Tax=Seiridium cardinale TaxID=138064 RepID=A0ABR2XNZ9_9PEZI